MTFAEKTAYGFGEVSLRPTRLLAVRDEAPEIKTFTFEGGLGSQPGQFVMLWIPEVGARPFSIYADEADTFALTIARIGEFTTALFDCAAGAELGYFGPFGRPFRIEGSRIALVGGGYGAAPLTYLAKRAMVSGIGSDLILGAREKSKLLYRDIDYPPAIVRHYCTDDGSFGFPGTSPDRLRELLETQTIDMVYTVGPELMMKRVADTCEELGVPYQISLERYMKCGYGLCGSCCVDPLGLRMCVEGPCIDATVVRQITEFGKYHRDAAGLKSYF